MTLKKAIGKVHLWLGLSSGLVVFLVAITGCIYAFQQEISDATQEYRFIEPGSGEMLPPSQLKSIAEKALPGKEVHAVLYAGNKKAAQVIFFHTEPAYYYLVYLNPYNGAVLHVKNMDQDFFRFILDGHFYLWLPEKIGQTVVAYATLVFVVMLISGIILWWPRTKGAARQRFSIKWSARWRRKNYDLHNVMGFYAFSVAFILALTGLVWGFEWFANAIYKTAGGKKEIVYSEPVSSQPGAAANERASVDRVWDIMRNEYPGAEIIEVHPPATDSSAIAANANPDGGTYWQTDYRYFDQHTLKEMEVGHVWGRTSNATAADKLFRMNYDIHVGAVLGLPGKILVFCASLIVASLPVSGFLIWWGRRKKVNPEEKKKAQTAEATAVVEVR